MLDSSFFRSAGLENIYSKIKKRERLSAEDGLRLFYSPDIAAIGALAHMERQCRHGNKTYFVVNRQVNYTNICINRCIFCAFRRDSELESGAFLLSKEQILEKIKEVNNGKLRLDELHIVGGCHPDLKLSFFVDLFESIRSSFPNLPIKAFTPVEINHFSQKENISTYEVLKILQKAGLVMMPGGGAEIFDPALRQKLCPEKADAQTWLRISGEAHSLGIKTNCTMLFGHLESYEQRILHLCALREQQDKSGGFTCFIPLPFLRENSRLKLSGDQAKQTNILDQLKVIAISRLMLDNIDHIKAYWVMLGAKTAQTALWYGADDLDGTIVEEKIGHMAGAKSDKELGLEDLKFMITQSGFHPVRRNAIFEENNSESKAFINDN